MNRRFLLFFRNLLLLSPLLATKVHASELWKLQSETPSVSATSSSPLSVATRYQVQFNSQLLQGLQQGDQVELPFPQGNMLWTIREVKTHANGSRTLAGHLADQEPVVLTYSKTSVFGRFNTPTQTFGLTGSLAGAQLQSASLLYSQPANIKTNDIISPEHELSPKASASQKPELWINENIRDDFANEEDSRIATIDVLALYNQAAEDLYNGDAQTRIFHLFAVANQAFTDSGVYIRMNPVLLKKAEPSDPRIQTHISEMSESNNSFQQLPQWRRQTGADIVTLFTPMHQYSDACGRAEVAVNNDSFDSETVKLQKKYTHSAVHIDCHDDTFAHELGHHLGLGHGNGRSDLGYSFSYARGHFEHLNFATIMVYSNLFSAKTPLKFSSPKLSCDNKPCGIAHTETHGADAVYAMNRVRFMVAQLWEAEPDGISFDQALDAVKDPALKSCLSELKLNMPELEFAGDLEMIGYYPLQGCDSVDPQQRKITDLADLHLFPNLQGLSLNAENITDFTPLVQLPKLKELSIFGAKKVSSMPWLSQLTSLRRLTVDYSNLGSTEYLKTLTQLKEINLSMELSGIHDYSGLLPLNSLEKISIWGPYSTPGLTDLSFLQGKTRLNTLRLINTEINDISMLSDYLTPGALDYFGLGTSKEINYDVLRLQSNLSQLDLNNSYRSDCTSLQYLFPYLTRLRVYNSPSNCGNLSPSAPTFAELPVLEYEATRFSENQPSIPLVYASDKEDGVLRATPDKFSLFPLGETTVLWRAIDSQNNVAEAPQIVRIKDTTAPLIFGPVVYHFQNNFNTEVNSNYYDQYDFYSKFYADDLTSGIGTLEPFTDEFRPMLEMRMEKPEEFAGGINEIKIYAKDHIGNESSFTSYFINHLRDGPRISKTEPLRLQMTDSTGVSGQSPQLQQALEGITARDSGGNLLPVIAKVPDWLSSGRHFIQLTATDGAGLVDGSLLEIQVGDFEGPVFAPLSPLSIFSSRSTGIPGAHPEVLKYLAGLSAQDAISPPVIFSYQLPERFAPGEHHIRVTATDNAGNSTTQTLSLEVIYQQRKSKLLKLLQITETQAGATDETKR